MDLKARQDHFLRLLDPLSNRLERFALVLTHNDEVAKDVVSETILIAWQRFDELRSEQAFLSFLFTIASRVYRKHLQKNRNAAAYNEELALALADSAPGPDTLTDVSRLHSAIKQLPHKQREALTMFELLGFSLKEIQQVQGGSISALKVRLMRARRRLASRMGIDETEQTNSRNLQRLRPQPDFVHIAHGEFNDRFT